MKTLYILSAVVALAGALPVLAAEPCSIHPAKGMSDTQLMGLAKVSRAEAEKIAIASLKMKSGVSTSGAELEAEHGCLLWSFDLRVAKKAGVEEVQIDAGNGKVLSVKHETPRQEAAEAKAEKSATSGK